MDNTSDIQTDKFLYEHALGALNGLAIGDALGMPSQTLTTQEIKEHYGGQQQRVALARAIVTNPCVLLLDEPLSALDKSLRIEMQFELKRIQREIGITTIFVTHDQEEALTLSDNIGILRNGQMIQVGNPRDVYHNPLDTFTATFLGEANNLSDINGDQVHIKGLNQLTTGKCLAVRAEHISISRMEPDFHDLSKFTAELDQLAFAGAMVTCIFRRDNKYIRVIAKNQDILSDIKEGERFWLSWPNDKTLTICLLKND